ncbi:hypothetical protein PQR53_08135 [Paraburkholderia fungorum]|uniref:hypothetical protein n=1 Tax=Paraburkholderia fungorum TaxID=134537 RepID=UPI0038BA5E22
MKTGIGRFGAFSAATVMTALVAAPMPAVAASGGTINFSGAIVAPQLVISAAPVLVPAGARIGAGGGRLAQTASAVTLTFSAPPGMATGADVALQVNNGATARGVLAERFVDSGGRVFRAARDGHYRIGRDGGVLSLAPKSAAQGTRVTVVVSYD